MTFRTAFLSAAAAIVTTGAMAADLPSTKSAPAQYVRICDVYGAGFFYIPGTDTCLKIGGRVRVEYMAQTVGNVWRHRSLGGTTNSFINKNGIDQIGWHSRARLDMDARTQTAWGTVQTVIQMRLRSRSGTYAANYTSGTYAAGNSFDTTLERAWIRFAGFTFGRGSSNFTTMPSTMYNSQYWGGFASGVNQLAYTATFGGGFSATLALEDRTDFSAASANKALTGANAAGGTNAVAVGFGATRLPALTGNMRVDQSWGSLQLSGAVIQNTANITTAGPAAVVNANGPLIKKTGWAVALGGHINLPMLARGDRFDFTVGYADGHMDMIFGSNLNGKTSSSAQYMGGLQRNDVNLTVYDCSVAAGIQPCSETTKGWNIGGILTHYWTPTVRSRVAGSYISVTPGSVTRRTDWLNGGLSRATAWTAVHQLEWTPTRGFFIGFELAYARLNQKFAGLNGAAPGVIPVAAACTTGVAGCAVGFANFKVSPNIWNARIRVERTF